MPSSVTGAAGNAVAAEQVASAWLDALIRLATLAPVGWYHEHGGAVAAVSGANFSSLNTAVSLDPELELASLDEAAAEVAALGLPWSITVRGTAGTAVTALAAEHGLTDRDELPLMVCAAEGAVLYTDKSLRRVIRPVGSVASSTYTEILTSGFGVPDGAFGTLMGGGLLDARGIAGYLAKVSGRYAATSLGITSGRFLGVYNIAVIPGARLQGIGRAMTARVMADGFAAGADTAYLQTSAEGRPLYESMGFRLAENWTIFSGSAAC